jgi:hypothetical protein
MRRKRQRRKLGKDRRHIHAPSQARAAPKHGRDLQLSDRVERLTYTRKQAAEALGVSLVTLDRRVVPAITTVKTEWGARLIPVDELERYLAERTEEARASLGRAARPGRKSGLPADVVARICNEHARGISFGEIARRLNAAGVRTSQGGRQWWPSTVRTILERAASN